MCVSMRVSVCVCRLGCVQYNQIHNSHICIYQWPMHVYMGIYFVGLFTQAVLLLDLVVLKMLF